MATTPRDAISQHMDAVNGGPIEVMIDEHRFPFTHLFPDGRVVHWPTAEDFQAPDFALAADWHHSTLESAREIMSPPHAVTFLVEFSRRRSDDSIIAHYEAVWIATCIDGDWKVQFRHGASKKTM